MSILVPTFASRKWQYGDRIPFERFELNVEHPLANGLVYWIPSKPQLGVNPVRDMSIYRWPLTTYNGGAIGYILDGEKGWVREFDDTSSDTNIITHYGYQDFNGFISTQIIDVNLHDQSVSNGALGLMNSTGSGGMYLLYRLSDASVVARMWETTGGTSTATEVDSNVTTNEWRQWAGVWRSSTWRALYIDADQQQVSTTSRTAAPVAWNMWYGGAYYDSGSTWGCDAYLGDGAIWNRGLTDDELLWYYNDPFVLYKPVPMPKFYSFPTATSDCIGGICTGAASLTGTGTLSAIGINATTVIGLNQRHFRFRNDNYGLNVDNGWLAGLDLAPSSLDMGQQFRLRIEIEESEGVGVTDGYKLQVKVNDGSWNDCTTQTSSTCTAVIVTNSYQYADQAATTNLLSGSSETFEAGEGLYDDNLTASHTLNNEHTEFEWALLTLKNYGSFAVLADGDTIYLRVVRDDGTLLDNYQDISYTVNEPAGFIGGTFVESAHSIGPVQDSNGNLYFFGEHSSQTTPTNNNTVSMWKSTDEGVTWDEVDGTNRPVGFDFESADMQVVNDIIYIAQHRGSAGVRLHVFNMSAASSNQDTWTTTDEVVDSSTPETDQAVALAVLSDGDMWCFYRTTVSTYESIVYKRRTSGSWGSRNTLDTQATTNFTWVACVVGESNLTHVFYQEITNGSGNIWHRSLSSGGTLSGRESISTASGTNNNNSKGIAKPLYWDDAGDEIIFVVYRESDNDAWSRTITNDGTPSAATGPINTYAMDRALGGSNMLAAQLVGDGNGNAWLIYLDNTNQHPYLLEYVYGTGWSSEITLSSTLTANFQHIGHYTLSNADVVVGYVLETHPYWDTAGSYGDDGLMWYYDYILQVGGRSALSGTGSLSAIGSVIAGFSTVTGAAALTGTGSLAARPFPNIPLNNMALWLTFDDISDQFEDDAKTTRVDADSDPIGAILDNSGNGSHATQTNATRKPAFKTNVQNGLDGALFTESDTDHVATGDNVTLGQTFTVFAVAKETSGIQLQGVVMMDNSAGVRMFQLRYANTNLIEFIGFSTTKSPYADNEPIDAPTNWHILEGVRRSTSVQAYADGYSGGSTATAGTPASDTDPVYVGIASRNGNTLFDSFNGNIVEVIIYNAELTDTQREQVENYLSVKWDIPLVKSSAATLSGTGSLSAVGSVIPSFAVVTGVAALTGTGTLSGAGIGIASSAVAMTGTGTLSAIGKQLLWPFSDDFTGSNDDPWATGKWTTGASP